MKSQIHFKYIKVLCFMSQHMSIKPESYLGRYGWDFVKKTEKRIVTGWQGPNRSYPLTIETSDTWASSKSNHFLTLK